MPMTSAAILKPATRSGLLGSSRRTIPSLLGVVPEQPDASAFPANAPQPQSQATGGGWQSQEAPAGAPYAEGTSAHADTMQRPGALASALQVLAGNQKPAQASEQINAFIANNRGAMPGLFGQQRRKTPSLFGGDTQPIMPQDGQDAPLAMSAQPFLQSTGDAQAPMNNPRLEQSVMPGMPPAQPQSSPQPAPYRPLGGSMREPFNYDQAMQAMLPPQPQHSKGHERLMNILNVVGAMAAGAAGQPWNDPLRAKRERDDARRYESNKLIQGWKHGDWQNQNEADLKAADPFTIGRDRLGYNPATGQTENLFHGPADWEAFAASKDLKPGTPEYFRAVDDFVLRSGGPSATENFSALDDHRTENDRSLENLQSSNRRGLETLRQGGVSSLETQRQTGRTGLETQRQQGRTNLRGLPTYRDTRGGGTHTGAVPTATGPNGEKLQYVGGKWIPLK